MSCCSTVFFGTKGMVRLPRGDADGLSVVPVVLLPTHEGLHILRADNLHLMPEGFKLPLPIESPRTGFKNHRAWIDLGDDLDKLISHHPTLQDNTAVAIDAVKLEHVLGDLLPRKLRQCELESVAFGRGWTMRRSRFSEEQIIGILREQEAGMKVAEVCRRHGISDATFYTWKSKYGGLEVSEARRLKSLEDENRRLKKLLAEAVLDNAALKDLLGKNG